MRARAAEVRTTVSTGSQDSLVSAEAMQRAVLHVEREHTHTFTTVHYEVESEILDEEVGVVSERLAVEGVQDGVPGTVSGSGTPIGLTTLAELEGLTAEGTLVDFAFLRS